MSSNQFSPIPEQKKKELLKLVGGKNKHLEDLLDFGLSLREMASLLNWKSKQRVQQALARYHMHGFWEIKRNEREQEKKDQKYQREAYMEKFYSLLFLKRQKMAREEGWAIEQVVNATMKPNCDLRHIKFFEENKRVALAYDETIKNGEKPKLTDLTKRAKLKFLSNTRRRLFAIFDGELQYTSRKRRTFSPELKQVMRRAYPLGMAYNDISYMIRIAYNEEVPTQVINHEINKMGSRKSRERQGIKGLMPESGKVWVPSYKESSEVYEAMNIGFKESELPELLNLHPEAVKYSIENREHIKNRIFYALDTIQPEKKHIYPFRT